MDNTQYDIAVELLKEAPGEWQSAIKVVLTNRDFYKQACEDSMETIESMLKSLDKALKKE